MSRGPTASAGSALRPPWGLIAAAAILAGALGGVARATDGRAAGGAVAGAVASSGRAADARTVGVARAGSVPTARMPWAPAAPARRPPVGVHPEDPDAWRLQVLEQLLPAWTRHGPDRASGGFHTRLDRRWRPEGAGDKYPGMLSRHLFSYSAAYLMSGEPRYLELARRAFDFLVGHGWDGEHGGWFDRLDRSGRPVRRTKRTFVQTYAAAGLTLYYFVTRDPGALDYVRRTHRILTGRLWDRRHGGYFQRLERDLSVEDSTKSAASQLAPVSGYLLYLYAATRDTSYLGQARRAMDVVVDRMRDPETGWVRERFAPDWTPLPGEGEETINVGHNLETAWMLARLELAGARAGSRGLPARLAGAVADRAFRRESGAWLQGFPRSRPGTVRDRVVWWIQAYGNMTELTLHRTGAATGHRDRYRRGVSFWNEHLMDRERGGTFLSVGADGSVLQGRKAGRWKTSYHAVEHGLWNWLGEALWLEGRPVRLHFRVPADTRVLHVVPVPDPRVRVDSVRVNGRRWEAFDAASGAVRLAGVAGAASGADTLRVRVTLSSRGGAATSAGTGQPRGAGAQSRPPGSGGGGPVRPADPAPSPASRPGPPPAGVGGRPAKPLVFMWTGAHVLMDEEPRMFGDILRFAARHGIVPYSSGSDDPEVARRFVRAAKRAGIPGVWVEISPRRSEIEGATAGQFAREGRYRRRTLARFREIARTLRDAYPDSTRITIFDEAPLGTFATEPGVWKADYEREVEAFRRHGPAAFAHMYRALKDVHPDARVGVFLHHPHNASPEAAGRWSLIDGFMERADELGAGPDFIYSDVYRGYFQRGFGYEATNAYVRDVAAHTARVAGEHGVPAYQLGQAHTIKLGYTPSRRQIDGNVEAMLSGGVDGLGWYWPNYAATDHVDPGVPAGYPVSYDPFVPNAWGRLGPAGSLYGTSRDRFVYAYLRALEATGRLEPSERFDLWIYGRDLDHVEHAVQLGRSGGEGGGWETLGHVDPDQDADAYVEGARPAYVRDRDGEWEAVVFHGLRRQRFFLPGEGGGPRLRVRVTTPGDGDGSELRAVYAMPYRRTRNYRTETEIAGLIRRRPRWIRVNSLAHHALPRPAVLEPGRPFVAELAPTGR